MRVVVVPRVFAYLFFTFVFILADAAGQVSVLTHHGDNARTGANLNESILTVSNVNTKNFGKLATRPVDGNIYAQPLVAAGVGAINRPGPTNLVIVATERNQVYAFDADDVDPNSKRAMVWNTGPSTFGPSVPTETLVEDIGKRVCSDLTPDIGITGTPVIRITTAQAPREGVVFVVAKTKLDAAYHYRLFALRLSDGTEIGRLEIEGEVEGTGLGSVGGKIRFDPMLHLNRPALLLVDNTLYVAFGGHCDMGDYHGWLFSFDVSNPKSMKSVAIYNTTPTGPGPDAPKPLSIEGGAGIWMSGEGPSADETGAVYFTTGNGTNNHTTDLGDSVVKLRPEGKTLEAVDWFTPDDEPLLKDYDIDFGSTGAVLLPTSHLLIVGTKGGRLYQLDRDNMGRGAAPAPGAFQVTHGISPSYGIHGTPAVWQLGDRMLVYTVGTEDPVTEFRLTRDGASGEWALAPTFRRGSVTAPYPNAPKGEFGVGRRSNPWFPGGFLTLSANGADQTTGILWIMMNVSGNASELPVRGVLRAMDASDISKPELWNSEDSGDENDRPGMFAKFVPPTVANGKVYVATFMRELADDEVTTGTGEVTESDTRAALVIYGLRSR